MHADYFLVIFIIPIIVIRTRTMTYYYFCENRNKLLGLKSSHISGPFAGPCFILIFFEKRHILLYLKYFANLLNPNISLIYVYINTPWKKKHKI